MPNEIVVQEHRSAALTKPASQEGSALLSLVERFASNPDLDPEKAEKLLNMFIGGQRKIAEMQDEKLFSDAMAAFKNEPGVVNILKDKKNKQYDNAPYASLGREASVIMPLLSKHGLSATWKLSQREKIRIECQISYGIYHAEPVPIELPPDASGAKNVAQQIKSSITYGRIITLECACGIAPVDSFASLNDDGNAMSPAQAEAMGCLEEGVAADFVSLIEGSGSVDELQTNYFKARDAAEAAKDRRAAKAFADTKNKTYKLLTKKAAAK